MALNILVPFGLIFPVVQSFWFVWVIYALATIFLQAMNVRLGLRVISHVKYARGGRFPWLPAVAFVYISYLIIVQIPTIIIFSLSDVSVQKPTALQWVLGIVLSLALITGLFIWFKKSICRNAPWLSKSIFAIGITILCLAVSVLALCVFLIALMIFKAISISSANDSEKVPTKKDPDYRCGTCMWADTAACPYFPDNSVDTCSEYLPKQYTK